jgi:hypothetical protein
MPSVYTARIEIMLCPETLSRLKAAAGPNHGDLSRFVRRVLEDCAAHSSGTRTAPSTGTSQPGGTAG